MDWSKVSKRLLYKKFTRRGEISLLGGEQSRENARVILSRLFRSFRFVSFRSFVYLTRRRVGSILKRPIKSLRNGKERDL